MLPGQQSLVTFNRIYTFSLRHSVPHLPIYRTVVPVAALPLCVAQVPTLHRALLRGERRIIGVAVGGCWRGRICRLEAEKFRD